MYMYAVTGIMHSVISNFTNLHHQLAKVVQGTFKRALITDTTTATVYFSA